MIEDKFKKGFYYFGNDVSIGNNVSFSYPYRTYIGNNVEIKDNSELIINSYMNKDTEYNIKIDDYVFINKHVIFEAFNLIEIGKYVAFGPRVYISDNSHQYIYFNLPIRIQGFNKNNSKVIIKDGAWIGEGAKILGNVTIGYGTVIGAGAVVARDIPDHTVVVGNPAKIIKICDYKKERWVDVKDNLTLLNDILDSRGIFSGYDHDSVLKILELGMYKDDVRQIQFKEIIDLIKRIEKRVFQMKDDFLLSKVNNHNIEITLKESFAIQNLIVNLLQNHNNINSEKYFLSNDNVIYAFENLINAINKNQMEARIKLIDLLLSKILVEWKNEIINILTEAGANTLLLS